MQNNTLSRADLSYDSGVAMNVHYGDILVKFGEVLDIKSERLPMIVDETVLDKYKSSFLKNGDIIIADTAEDETVGKCTEIAGLSDEYVISGLHTIPYRPLQKFAFGYLGYYMNSTSYHNQLLPLMQGIKVTSISKVSLQNTVIIYPKSKVEQAAIGKYFYNLDNLITLHQRKIQLYNRFMTIVWEQRKLGDVIPIITDYVAAGSFADIAKHVNYKSKPSYAQLVRTIDLKHNFKSNDSIYVDKEAFEYLYRVNLNVESIVLPNIGANIGEVYYIDPSKFPFPRNVLGPNAIYLIPNENIKFIYSFFQTKEFQKEIFVNVASSGQPKFNKTELKRITISLPKSKEQKCIGLYFQYLDNLITLHQWKWYFFDKKVGNAWEQRKAEELCSISTGKSNTQDQIDDGKYPFYIRSDIPVRSDKYLYDCEAVITIGDGNIGKVFHYVKGKFDLHQRCYKMTDFNGILGKYYYYFFSTNFYERAMRMTAKGTVDSVRLDMISKMDIKMPKKISEQKKIADCLTKLDNLITLHQWKWFVYGKIRGIVWIQRKSIKILVIQRKYTLLRVVIVFEWFIICCVCFENIQLRFIAVIEFKIFCIIVDEYVVLIVIECIYVIVVFEVYYALLEFVLIIKSCYVFDDGLFL